ncbi:hypothetical protein SADFL11_00048890 [Roseibium alexandrii DFL-11]|uniref:Uncharacterized protein n=1 Tax=Roseibium alexandrii (strain DSM 17067 / NCIMB 14079 / DFL-11) TaxID=244592 RepID=A0A5E8UWR7_ROSAD|nr:hypothetical protein SADFL11_00048890 [Roseibium alexandrii DFL-11]
MKKYTSLSIRKETRDLLRTIAKSQRRSIAETVSILVEKEMIKQKG